MCRHLKQQCLYYNRHVIYKIAIIIICIAGNKLILTNHYNNNCIGYIGRFPCSELASSQEVKHAAQIIATIATKQTGIYLK